MVETRSKTTAQQKQRLRFAIVGAGFWSRYQLAAWTEIAIAECVAVVDRDVASAERMAKEFGVPQAAAELEEVVGQVDLDFVDIISSVDSHAELIREAVRLGIGAAFCQKPLTPDWQESKSIVKLCHDRDVVLSVHENWRWQAPIRGLQQILASDPIGRIFRASMNYNNSFPVFDNQPYLKTHNRFMMADMGPHLFDLCRFLFGEVDRLYCQTARSRDDIRGEDTASVLMETSDGVTLSCNMSYGSRLECDRFPETFVTVEGERGTVELSADHWISVTTSGGTHRQQFKPPYYPWADARYALVHSSMVACHENLTGSLQSGVEAETSAADNLKTLAIIEAAYRSAETKQVVSLSQYSCS